jgi:hypothetical protein
MSSSKTSDVSPSKSLNSDKFVPQSPLTTMHFKNLPQDVQKKLIDEEFARRKKVHGKIEISFEEFETLFFR